jgi:hypothetical protein
MEAIIILIIAGSSCLFFKKMVTWDAEKNRITKRLNRK